MKSTNDKVNQLAQQSQNRGRMGDSMKRIMSVASRRKLFIVTALCCFFVATGLTYASGYVTPLLINLGLATQIPEPDPKVLSGSPQLIIVYSTPHGFEPDEMNVTAGPKRIMVRNRTGLEDLRYVVTKPGKTRPVTELSPLGSNTLIDYQFTADEIVLTEATHPDWVCRFRIVE